MAMNKVVLITGASSGIGAGIARELAAAGAKLVLGARRMDRLEALADELRRAGADVVAHPLNVTHRESVADFVEAGRKAFGQVDVIVNNAGIMPLSLMSSLKVAEWDRMIDVNIKGVLYGIAAVLPGMRDQQSGHIINIASVAGVKVFSPIGTVYSATKFAVRAISEGLRSEAPAGVRTTIISPGAIESELKQGSTDPETAQGVQAFYKANEISSDSVARAIVYAIQQPNDVDINEIVLRPTAQEF